MGRPAVHESQYDRQLAYEQRQGDLVRRYEQQAFLLKRDAEGCDRVVFDKLWDRLLRVYGIEQGCAPEFYGMPELICVVAPSELDFQTWRTRFRYSRLNQLPEDLGELERSIWPSGRPRKFGGAGVHRWKTVPMFDEPETLEDAVRLGADAIADLSSVEESSYV